jgi:hypothetical protein
MLCKGVLFTAVHGLYEVKFQDVSTLETLTLVTDALQLLRCTHLLAPFNHGSSHWIRLGGTIHPGLPDEPINI